MDNNKENIEVFEDVIMMQVIGAEERVNRRTTNSDIFQEKH